MMNMFNIPESISKPLGAGIGIVATLALITAIGIVTYNKMKNRVFLTLNKFEFDDSRIKLNITLKNLRDKKVIVIYHFEYRDFISNKFVASLKPYETKAVDISHERLPHELDEKLFKLVVDGVKISG